ncbi:hypothetical protein BIW11_12589 [Tropilaelaps mercedesae]|uniref:RRM domain-containing protein n=1 Tax=Tropilaelaps mercedesae TaxID=418985 RepID=A0A1V9X6A4_9ACAR|nr:hypothetical protein BIW11_12589 [Tropilaelaps mercedesae]
MNRKGSDRMDVDRDRVVYKDRVFVGKLPKGATEHELRSVFENIGLKVNQATIQSSARDTDFAFVSFYDERSVGAALERANKSPLSIRGNAIAVHQAYTRATRKIPRPPFQNSRAPPMRGLRHHEPPLGMQTSPHRASLRVSPVHHASLSPPPPPPPPPPASVHVHGSNGVMANGRSHSMHNSENTNSHLASLYNMNEFVYATYPVTGVLSNGQVVAIQPGPHGLQHHPLYLGGAEYPRHQGQIPYCGSRRGGDVLLPANPGIDASKVEPLSQHLQFVGGTQHEMGVLQTNGAYVTATNIASSLTSRQQQHPIHSAMDHLATVADGALGC